MPSLTNWSLFELVGKNNFPFNALRQQPLMVYNYQGEVIHFDIPYFNLQHKLEIIVSEYEIPDDPQEFPDSPPMEDPLSPEPFEPLLPDTPEPEPLDVPEPNDE